MAWRTCFLLFPSLALLAAASAAAELQWIWGTDGANREAPVGTCLFQRTFEITGPKSGTIEIACDDRYVLRLNGTLVGASHDWHTLDRYDVSALLVEGSNRVDVRCTNDVGPAGLVARVAVHSKGGVSADYSTDATWKASLQAGQSWNPAAFANLKEAQSFASGSLGEAEPWAGRVDATADWVVVGVQHTTDDGPLDLNDGDRVVLLGNTLIERAGSHGYFETTLRVHFPGRELVFRNLGWSGDTVSGIARARFGSVSEGFAHLAEYVYAEKPTVIIVAYGANEAYAGGQGLSEFRVSLDHLLDVLAGAGARIVLVSPIKQENHGPPLPDPSKINDYLQLYSEAIKQSADERGHRFVDLYTRLGRKSNAPLPPTKRLTDNGVHLTAQGYRRAADVLEQELGLEPNAWAIEIDATGKKHTARGIEVEDLRWNKDVLRFTATPKRLALPRLDVAPAGGSMIQVTGLDPGRYELRIEDRAVVAADAEAWEAGMQISQGPCFDQVEAMREAIVKKNELYLHRWRPHNETYLYLFRKHEQGNNAREIPQFDPLIADAESRIRKLSVPVGHRFELAPTTDSTANE